MRKMFSENQIKEIIKKAIKSGEIAPVLVLQGLYEEQGSDSQTLLQAQFNSMPSEGKYYTFAFNTAEQYVIEVSIDFENQKIYNSEETEILLDGATIELVNILNNEVIKSIDM